ncbi:hypothetical protein [Aureivirga sp. CE67]|uniref:hypothetical protein n=1 Tax=Aureivirga sp. CE67 TaxID=1788983 RepID=UPI0018CBECFC|nr:hypothetical protein [Aureivirga sp. CE67]
MKNIDKTVKSQFRITRKYVNKKKELQPYYLFLQIEELAKKMILPYQDETSTLAKNTSLEIRHAAYLQDTIHLKGEVEFQEDSTINISIIVYKANNYNTTILSKATFSYDYKENLA